MSFLAHLSVGSLFVVACVLAPAGVELLCYEKYLQGSDVCPSASVDAWSRIATYFSDTWLLSTVFGALLTAFISKYSELSPSLHRNALLPSENGAATWYLLSGWFMHMLIHGLSGSFHHVDLLTNIQIKTDARFGHRLGDERGSTVWVMGVFELFVTGPLCLILFFAYHQQWTLRDILEVIVCIFQLCGVLMVSGTEVMNGLFNVWRGWDLTSESVVFFWFGFVIHTLVGVCVPLALGFPAFVRVSAACATWHESVKEVKVD
mmetsp:Transcript_10669/g.29606  ORF Transcript_10669/g.29606 Transcript_10669/m.29606 type:complete len:262 (-) Transcript_10669:125-910(-)